MRKTPEQRDARLRERTREAAAACGGELTATALRWMGLGSEQLDKGEFAELLAELVDAGEIAVREVPHVVGRHGAKTKLYRAATVTIVPPDGSSNRRRMALDLAPLDRKRLIDAAYAQTLAARDDAHSDAEAAAAWSRIMAVLLAGEFDPGDADAMDGEAS